MKRADIILVAYVAMSIFTFGYAAAHHECGPTDVDKAFCDKGFQALPAGPFWPLYWSWELQERLSK